MRHLIAAISVAFALMSGASAFAADNGWGMHRMVTVSIT